MSWLNERLNFVRERDTDKWHVFKLVKKGSGEVYLYNQAICPELDSDGVPLQSVNVFYDEWVPASNTCYEYELDKLLEKERQEKLSEAWQKSTKAEEEQFKYEELWRESGKAKEIDFVDFMKQVKAQEKEQRKIDRLRDSLKLGRATAVTRNQATRDAIVIGETSTEVLVAYAMPSVYMAPKKVLNNMREREKWQYGDAVYLNQIEKDGRMLESCTYYGDIKYPAYKAVSRNNPPKKWEQAIKDAESDMSLACQDEGYKDVSIFSTEFWQEYYCI